MKDKQGRKITVMMWARLELALALTRSAQRLLRVNEMRVASKEEVNADFKQFAKDFAILHGREGDIFASEIKLRNQVERYKGRMITMRGWILADNPGRADRMLGWFDVEGEVKG